MVIRRLLISRFSAMGDVAMCVPAVWSLAQEYKNLEIVFLSRKNFAPMFSQMPDNVKFWGIDLKNDYKGISGLNHLFAEIKKQNFDAYADFHDVLRTKYLKFRASLSGIKTAKIDKGRRDKKRITRKGAINYKPLKTTSERYKNVLEKLGFEFEINFTSIYNKGFALPQEVAKICGEKTAKWIGIAPFAAHKGKILPLATTEKIVEILSDRETKVFLFGAGEKEKSILEEWQAKYKNVVSTAGKLGGLANELPLISQLDCMLSMDSANMHLASLVGTRAVSVWGATHPAAGFLGFNQKEEDTIQITLPCRPCSIYGNKECRLKDKYLCLNSITAESVVEKILSVLNA